MIALMFRSPAIYPKNVFLGVSMIFIALGRASGQWVASWRWILVCLFLIPGSAFAADINFLVMPGEVVGPISPYIYGINDKDPGDTHTTVRRLGGNRATGYNWENNASNAGSDWKQSSDNWFCADNFHYTDCDQPGAMVKHFVEDSQKAGMDSLITVPMAGYVAADKNGPVLETEAAPSKRWVKVSFHKKSPFTLTPNLTDGVVYEDEFVNFLVQNFKKASDGGVKFYDLDNETAIWPSTHPRLHPKKTEYWEMINRTEGLATNILLVDPTAQILGPVCYGWTEFISLQDAPDSKELNATFGTYLDFYLEQMKVLEQRHHKRLLHALDLHWYPEAQGAGKRITDNDISPESIEARLQAPRSLWDPAYMEKSWITNSWGKPIQLITWVKEKIDKHYPGTKLAFTEYDYGAGDHISGGLAQADVLGIFGKYGVYLSSYWGDLKPYNKAAFKFYRNYDGNGSAFGDTEISSGTDDIIQTSVYAATDSKKTGTVWIVVLNKNQKDGLHGKFKIQGKDAYKAYEAYGFDHKSPEIKLVRKGNINDKNQFDL
ncbi:MAG TPA: glycoside hydrolase family 44 protein, partial [bacterium]